jgi:hypothetical protein
MLNLPVHDPLGSDCSSADDELMESLRTSRRQATTGDTVPLRDQG